MSGFGRTGKTEARGYAYLCADGRDAALWALGGILILSMPRAVGAGRFLAVTFGLGSLPYVGLVLISLLSCSLSLCPWRPGTPRSLRRMSGAGHCGAEGARCGEWHRSMLKWSVAACLVFQSYALIRASLGGYDQAVAWRIEPESYIELVLYLVLALVWCSYTSRCSSSCAFACSAASSGGVRRSGCLLASIALAGLALGLLPMAIDGHWLDLDGEMKAIASLVGGVAGVLLSIVVTAGVALAPTDRIDVLNCLCIAFGGAFVSRIGVRIVSSISVLASRPVDDGWFAAAVIFLMLMSVFLFAVYVRFVVVHKAVGFSGDSDGGTPSVCLDVWGQVLTERERQVADMSLRGMTLSNIADELGIALSTVGTYRARTVEKLGCGSWNEAIRLLQSSADDSMGDGEDGISCICDNEHECTAVKRALVAMAVTGAVCSAVSAVAPEAITACLQALASLFLVYGISKSVLPQRGASDGLAAWGDDIKAMIWLAIVGVGSCMATSLVIQRHTIGGVLARLLTYALCLLAVIALATIWSRFCQCGADSARIHFGKNDERAKSYLQIRGIGGTTLDVLLATCRQEPVAAIANELCIAPTTVISCRARGYRKLGVRGKEGLLSLLARELS